MGKTDGHRYSQSIKRNNLVVAAYLHTQHVTDQRDLFKNYDPQFRCVWVNFILTFARASTDTICRSFKYSHVP